MPPTSPSHPDLSLSEPVKARALAFRVFLGLLYAQLALALVPSWNDGTYYDYGFLVPFLVPDFFLSRWKECGPDAATLDRGLRRLGSSVPLALTLLAGILFIGLMRLTQWADSGWRTPLYLHAFAVLFLTAVLLFRLQGRSAANYWACAVIVLMAVPLPSGIEHSLIRNLTMGVLEFALFINRMLGLPLESSGETIFANGIPLQVSDGCSGIRSFQSGIFAGFVLGEFLRLSAVSRLLLFGSGLGLAFLMNGCRVIYLVRHAVAHPDADLQKIHDISGYVSLSLTFVLILGTGWSLSAIETRVRRGFQAHPR
jgi:exosortase